MCAIFKCMWCDVFMCSTTSIPTRRCYWTGSAAHNVKMMYEGFKKDVILIIIYSNFGTKITSDSTVVITRLKNKKNK